MAEYDNIVQQIAVACKQFGPAPSLICERLGITRKSFFQFINHYAELRMIYHALVEEVIEAIEDAGANKMLIAERLGKKYKRRDITRFIQDNVEIREVFQDKEDEIMDLAQQKIIEAMKMGDMNAVETVIKYKGGDQGWSRSQKINLDKEAARLGVSWQDVVATLVNGITAAASNTVDDSDNVMLTDSELEDSATT
jgi:hypothetical protein